MKMDLTMYDNAPMISIYLPCYNYGHFLEKAVDSILSQDFRDFELLLANDGSTDNTHELCLKYQAQDPRVIYVNNEKNMGIHQTCNKLLALARGRYITGIAADDFYLPRRLSAAYEVIQANPDIDIVFCKTVLVDEKANYLWTTSIPSFLNFDNIGRDEFREHIRTGGTYFHLSSCIISRQFIAEHGWYEEWQVPKERKFTAEDWEANLRWTKAAKIGYVNKPLYAFRVHGSNFSSEQKMLADGGLLRAHLTVLDKYVNPETEYRLRGVQDETLFHLFGQLDFLSQRAPEIADKVLLEIHSQLGNVRTRLKNLGSLPIPPLSDQPLITVIIPTFNAACAGNPLAPSGRYIYFILHALESLCKQTYTNWQAVIVNDGGEDIAPLLEEFKQKHQVKQNIQYFYFNVNQGQAAARNVGLEFIWQGELVTFLDDDDLYLPHHLEDIVQSLRGTSIPCAYTNYAIQVENCTGATRVVIDQIPVNLPPTYSQSLLGIKNYIPMSTFVVRRECILDHEVRFDQTLKILEDWEFLLRLSTWYEFTYLPTHSVEIRRREQSDSVHQLKINTYLETYEKICGIYNSTDLTILNGRENFRRTLEKSEKRINDRQRYSEWRKKKEEYTEQNLLVSLYKMERISRDFPHFLIIVKADRNNAEWLNLTIDSIRNQYYRNYTVVVLKEKECVLQENDLIQYIFEYSTPEEATLISRKLVQQTQSEWIITLHVGMVLDTLFSVMLVNQMNQFPMHQVYYFDEDALYVTGSTFTDSQFKTDFNLDLFRAMPQCIGECLVIKTQVVKNYELPLFATGWNYRLILSIYDALGREAIGHIEDIFVHIIHGSITTTASAADLQKILQEHLGVYGISAPITPRQFIHDPHQFFFDIHYVPQHFSKVTILCTAIYDIILWMNQIVQLVNNTHYRNYEFVALPAMFEFHQDALDFYVDLTKKDSRYRFVESIAEIDSPYIFYFDENITIPTDQQEWLTRLVGCMERQDLMIDLVKPALVDPLSYSPVDMFAVDATETLTNTLLLRRQVPQQFQHIDSLLGVLIKKSCLCDPHFDLAHSEYKAMYLPTVQLLCTQDEVTPTHYRWMQDPISYNKNLSLRIPFQIETEFVVNWQHGTRQSSVKKILQLTPTEFSPLKTLVSKGLIHHITLDIEKRLPLFEELVRFAPNIIILTLDQDYHDIHPHLRALKKCLPELRILLVIDQFKQYTAELDRINYYSLRVRLRAFDYVSKVLLINTDYLDFEPYTDIFPCESILLSHHLLTHPEEYLDVLF